MDKNNVTRRHFMAAASAGTVAALTAKTIPLYANAGRAAGKLAIKGGTRVRTKGWPSWPVWDKSAEDSILSVLRSGNWFRGRGTKVSEFEEKYAQLMGAKRCLATASGTTALLTALHALGIDAGDEVITSPYTFIATYNAVFLSKALPVFADTDPDTFQINPDKIEERITERTKAIMPVHILGLPADMDRINAIAKKWRGKKCGTVSDLGCFSFQNSKHLPSGEGGAVVGDNDEIMDLCHSFHNCGRPYRSVKATSGYPTRGSNRRMQQFQAVILMSQMKRLEKDTELRNQNARYLTSRIKDIPGIVPHKLYEGVTRAAYHLYPFRYKKEHFNNAPRSRFLAALRAEGIPCSGGYGKRLYSKKRLQKYRDELHFPDNDRLCQEAVWLSQTLLLTAKKDMDDIADAIRKIYDNRDKLA